MRVPSRAQAGELSSLSGRKVRRATAVPVGLIAQISWS
jgi:hypothetical protein